ncbi:Acetylglucosaminyltransferase EXT1/exostosin 1 [Handroanthus impetiginosus]|uniref:Acetylglucosaminyltransferase EXT1/exostosin 1 n=1 Tax=Handroanthus impetiginosus TaxID=429701 RepID=A0A2G9HS55_9LAMI|nr:Acetylglucosaminyltransferase EXT1/exostosin 1 [Handroanthus impetiginosus]
MRDVIVRFISKAPCIRILAFVSLATAVLLALLTNGSRNLSFFSLPSSPWAWTPSSSSFSFSAFSTDHPSPPPPPPVNPNTAMYPTFTSPKKQKAVANLVKELNEETMKRRGKERDKKMERIEASLASARALIKDAINKSRYSPPLVEDVDYVPQGEIYRNAYVFQRSYMLMGKMLKIYVYEEGEPPLFHYGPSKDIYSTEGIFLGLIESSHHFRTYDPDEAHVFFLPFSVVMILQHLFDPIERDKGVLERVIGDYVRMISIKYPYWNRSLGADHFMLSCHDWGPRATWSVHHLYFTSIRVLCNANTSEFFNPRKDVSFPEINLRTGNIGGLLTSGSSDRTILAFFAGRLHGRIRPWIFRHWKDKDPDIKVFERVPENSSLSYKEMMENSKYCLCPSGYEVASPRIVEAIYAECVPVLISEDYIMPFNDVLDWDKFSVRVSVGELPELKRILLRIGNNEYESLRRRVRQVQRHFVVNDPPKRYDVFHMMVHSLWLRRLNLRINA